MDSFENLAFLRGTSRRHSSDTVSIEVPRRDRKPKDSSAAFHAAADDWFDQKFGRRYRSGGLFVTSRRLTATTYAASEDHVMRIVPLSAYSYCWSPNVSDLLFMTQKFGAARREAIWDELDRSGYITSDLKQAHDLGHEVMIYCDLYAAIPIRFLQGDLENSQSRIILPGK
jgi:hypothetical protein